MCRPFPPEPCDESEIALEAKCEQVGQIDADWIYLQVFLHRLPEIHARFVCIGHLDMRMYDWHVRNGKTSRSSTGIITLVERMRTIGDMSHVAEIAFGEKLVSVCVKGTAIPEGRVGKHVSGFVRRPRDNRASADSNRKESG